MRVLCLGGGPAGLYCAISMKLRDPAHEVVVLERNKADDTFGWGVVLSDDAMEKLRTNDPVSAVEIEKNFAYWDDIAVVQKGHRTVSGGHGFAGIGHYQRDPKTEKRDRHLKTGRNGQGGTDHYAFRPDRSDGISAGRLKIERSQPFRFDG